MSTGTKIALACAIAGVVFSALAGEITGIAWAVCAGFWIWQYDLMRQEREDLRSGRANRPGEYRVTVRPETFQHFMDLIDNTPPPPSPGHYSVGGTRPHLCVCGKPLEDHR